MSIEKKLSILESILGSFHKTGKEYLFQCPVETCHHHKRKLSVNIEKNSFKCWICEYSSPNIYRLIKRFGNYNQKQEWLSIDNKVDLSFDPFTIFNEKDLKKKEEISLPKEFASLTKKNLSFLANEPLKYLYNRGITKEDILRWKIGYCSTGEYKNRIIVPSFDMSGKIDYFIARSYTDEWNKYKNPPIEKTNLLFNSLYVSWDEDVILTEGVFDAIVAGNSIPILGSSLKEDSKIFEEIVKNDACVYVALDYDAEKKANKLISQMIKYDIELYKVDVSGIKDIGSISKEEFKERKKKATKMTSENLLRYQIEGSL